MKEIKTGKIFYHLTGYLNKYYYVCIHPTLKDYHIFIVGESGHLIKVIHDDEIEKSIFSDVEDAINHEIEKFQKEFYGITEFKDIPIEEFLRNYFYRFIVERDMERK